MVWMLSPVDFTTPYPSAVYGRSLAARNFNEDTRVVGHRGDFDSIAHLVGAQDATRQRGRWVPEHRGHVRCGLVRRPAGVAASERAVDTAVLALDPRWFGPRLTPQIAACDSGGSPSSASAVSLCAVAGQAQRLVVRWIPERTAAGRWDDMVHASERLAICRPNWRQAPSLQALRVRGVKRAVCLFSADGVSRPEPPRVGRPSRVIPSLGGTAARLVLLAIVFLASTLAHEDRTARLRAGLHGCGTFTKSVALRASASVTG